MECEETIKTFWELHDSCFVIPNPWDRGSARMLASLGYGALATTSAGLSFALGRPDSPRALTREEALRNIREIVEATDLPVTADFQSGYGVNADEVYENVDLCIKTGVAGLSIEDAGTDFDRPLFDVEEAADRVRAARAAIDSSGRKVMLTARAECFLVGHADPLAEARRRLATYAAVGADCLYAPGLKTADEITEVVSVASGLPVNVLAADPGMTVSGLAELGVRRISVGSALARVALKAVRVAAAGIVDLGSFATLVEAESFAKLNDLYQSPQ